MLVASTEARENGRPADLPRGKSVLSLQNVNKFYGKVKAVDGVSLEVRQGEILSLLGPSGCGKTTTLRMIIGLERCDAGEIIYDGRIVDSPEKRITVPPNKRNMGMVFQSYAIWPHLTVFENVAYPLRVRRIKEDKIRELVGKSLEQVGMGHLAERPATHLSGGQQQRVALARGLVYQPGILLLDEPLSNLDAKLREHMRAELKLLQRQIGITIVFVTHDQSEAMSLSDRMAVMNGGRLEQVGSPQELYRHPLTPMVRDFLGTTVLIEGKVVETRGSGDVVLALPGDSGVVICRNPTAAALSSGQACDLAVRPEHLHVSPHQEETTRLGNTLMGRIQTLLFLGDRYEARVLLPWGQSLLLAFPPTDAMREGQHVRITVPQNDVTLWPK